MADKKPMSEAKRAANKKWNDANLKDKYDRIQLVVPKGDNKGRSRPGRGECQRIYCGGCPGAHGAGGRGFWYFHPRRFR